ncbi:glycoside hydrolase family 2 protein [Hymenobacter persicinus]|uniref:beta-galactosidase n=1 Tax=Hymenobacter persicinus TaxID=2025506 RepID=A0A4Q5L841_9BACT|nr:glycoside hydrolase family 2 TIM barrel-domain containing protein [Hymenobacter persicinus]RYU75330.1 glycoside hydrolase family 2 [Hymenobacter persicinus]
MRLSSFLWLLALLCLSLPARAQLAASGRQVQYLSGTDNGHTATWDFFCTGGRRSGTWTTIQVPSCWEQQGFGSYNYGRDYKTYGKNFRFADEKGLYKHRFRVPAGWRQGPVFIVFEGSMTDTEVKLNGQLVGPVHQGAFYRFKYELTDKLRFDAENLLEVTVSKMSAEPTVNNAERLADYWVFGGIFRPVYLEAYPAQFAPHLALDARADGSFVARAELRGLRQSTAVRVDILDAQGRVVGTAAAVAAAADTAVQLRTRLAKPRLWTAETPNLYRARLTLTAAGQPLYQTTERFGFRTIEVRRGRGIFVNGVQIKLKGINRHSFWPETGRTLNDSIQLLDVRLLKEMNLNAVRMAHYPPDAQFLNLCDSLGLYVLDELAGWQKAYSTAAGAKLVREMVRKDLNHPSILFWSNGNEGGTNKNLDDDFAQHDLSRRPVIHAHHRPGNAFNGIDTNHYEDYYSTQKILADSLIYMPTEFLHAQDDGGGGTGLHDFWELHWAAPRSGGGFLWALLDEGLVRTDQRNRIDVNGVNAPDGVLGPHREKEGSFYAIREVFSPIKLNLTELPAKFRGIIPVENRYHFTNLSQCFFQYELVRYRQPGEAFAGSVGGPRGRISSPDVPPLGRGKLSVKLPADWQQYDALLVSAYDAQKNLVYKWSWKIRPNAALLVSIVRPAPAAAPAVQVTESDSVLVLAAAGITVGFDKRTGELTGIKGNSGNALSLAHGPVLVGGQATFAGLRHYAEAGGEVVEAAYRGDLQTVRWQLSPGGWLRLDYEYRLTGDFPFAGLSFTYPENYVLGARWLGKGPYRVWKNRLQGQLDNVWENAYNNTQTGAAPWLYPEFKGYFADITWLELNTVEGKFLVASPDPGLYVRLFDFYGLSGVKPFPALPPGNFSLLDAIPPLGTKLALNIDANTRNLGPSGELNHLQGAKRRTLYFFFGLATSTATPQPYTAPEKDDLF